MGPLRYLLSMEFARSKKGIFISQRKYIFDLLNETGLLGCKAIENPIEPNLKLQPASLVEVIDKEKCQRLVGRLIYLSYSSQYCFCSKHGESIHALTKSRTLWCSVQNFKVLKGDSRKRTSISKPRTPPSGCVY